MKLIYILHPIARPSPDENIAKILNIIKHINLTEEDVIPLCPYIGDVLSSNEDIPEQRQRGLNNGLELIKRIAPQIHEARLYGNKISPGMQAEKELFESLGVNVRDCTVAEIPEEYYAQEAKVVMSHATPDTEEIKESNGDRRFYIVRQ